MPTGDVRVGEVWETTAPEGRTIRGIVADVTSTMLTLVSFTGNRFRIAPDRFATTWSFSQPPPPTALRCSRRGCSHAGILRYVRGSTSEWVCPRHLPVGVQATLTTESLGTRPPETAQPLLSRPIQGFSLEAMRTVPASDLVERCRNCQNPDPVEDHRVQLPTTASVWQCPRCSERWCIIADEGLNQSLDLNPLIPDLSSVMNEVRVRLLGEYFTVENIETSTTLYRALWARQLVSGDGVSVDERAVYSGIPISGQGNFAQNNPPGTIFRLRLRGGPEHRPPPAPRFSVTARQAEESLASLTLPANPVQGQQVSLRDIPSPGNLTIQAQGQTVLQGWTFPANAPFGSQQVSDADTNGLLSEMAPPYVSKGTRWVNRSTGDIVEVDHLGRSTDGGDPIVHFKRISDTHESNSVVLQRDFENMFRPFAQETPKIAERVVEVLKDEEWEHGESGEVVRIDQVDTKRNLVIVMASDKRRSVPMLDFVQAKWRKIVRKTAYARLLEDD